ALALDEQRVVLVRLRRVGETAGQLVVPGGSHPQLAADGLLLRTRMAATLGLEGGGRAIVLGQCRADTLPRTAGRDTPTLHERLRRRRPTRPADRRRRSPRRPRRARTRTSRPDRAAASTRRAGPGRRA